MKTRRGFKLILASLFFALLSCGTLYWYLQGMNRSAASDTMQEVVVAKQAIPANREVKAEYLDVKEMPARYVPSDAVKTVSQTLGKVTRVPLVPGEILYSSHLMNKKTEGGLALMVPSGYRAMTVSVDQVTGVAGLIRPGNYVDVLYFLGKDVAGSDTEGTLLTKKLVLAVDQNINTSVTSEGNGNGKMDGSKTVTLAVTPAEAQNLGLAMEIGNIRLILRPQEETGEYKGKNITPADLLRRPGSSQTAP